MLSDLVVFVGCAAIGVALQRRDGGADRLRTWLWNGNYYGLIPLAAIYAFLSIDLDRSLLGVVGCGVTAWWLTVMVAGLWARLVAPTREVRAALWLVGGFPNTGYIGFPLALLAFGTDGLRLAVVYDQVSLVVPMIVVATTIARRSSRGTADVDAAAGSSTLRDMLLSPPLLTVLALLALRATVVPEPIDLEPLGRFVALVVGPVGFLLLGLSIPLGGFTHRRSEVLATTGAVLVRIAVAPAMVLLVATVTGIDVPNALFLLAALPTAFMTLVVARVHDLEVEVVRLGLLATTILVVGGTATWIAITGGAAS